MKGDRFIDGMVGRPAFEGMVLGMCQIGGRGMLGVDELGFRARSGEAANLVLLLS